MIDQPSTHFRSDIVVSIKVHTLPSSHLTIFLSISHSTSLAVSLSWYFPPISLSALSLLLLKMSAAISGRIELPLSRMRFNKVDENEAVSDMAADLDDDDDGEEELEDVATTADQDKMSTIIQDLKTALLAARYVFLILLCLSLLLMYQFTIAPYVINPWKDHDDGIVNTAEKLVRFCSFLFEKSNLVFQDGCFTLPHFSFFVYILEICATCTFYG